MLLFLDKWLSIFFRKDMFDAAILGEVQLDASFNPYFSVKMAGCNFPVNIDAEDIVNNYLDKFSQRDIKIATLAYVKHRKLLQLTSIQKNFAILFDKADHTYQLLDLSNSNFIKTMEINSLKPEDAFVLGVNFEKIQMEKSRKFFNLTKFSGNNIELRLVNPNE